MFYLTKSMFHDLDSVSKLNSQLSGSNMVIGVIDT